MGYIYHTYITQLRFATNAYIYREGDDRYVNLDWSWGRSRRRAHTREREVGEVGPVPELAGIAADADPVRVRGRRAVEDEELVPARRGDERVRGGGDGAARTRALEGWEESAGAHGVTVGAGDG